MRMLTNDQLAGDVTREGIDYLRELFSGENGEGTQMAVRATAGLEDPATIAASCAALATDLEAAIGEVATR